MAFLSLAGVEKSFGGTRVLARLDLDVEEGELLCLVGPSGCGKSTLLRLVAGLESPTAGTISIGGRDATELEPVERGVAMVFQNYALYPHMTVRRNLAFPLRMARLPREETAARVDEAARLLGLSELLDRKPATLSGGQMQRVALGRAIVRRPRVFLFDEPLSNLDARLRTEMRREIVDLQRRLSVTSLYVTHDQEEAMTVGSRLGVLEGGRLLQVGTPLELYERPAHRFVAGFLGSPPMNLLDGVVEDAVFRAGDLTVEAPGYLGPGPVTLGVRPHDLIAGTDLRLAVERVETLGPRVLVHGHLGGTPVVVDREAGAAPTGSVVELGLPRDRVHWFGSSGARLGPTAPPGRQARDA